jgi:hypothetical protein
VIGAQQLDGWLDSCTVVQQGLPCQGDVTLQASLP